MADLHGFNAEDVEPAADFEPIPAGKYLAVITDSEMKPTKSGNGSYLELTFQVIEGEYKNRLLWARLNLDNPNNHPRTVMEEAYDKSVNRLEGGAQMRPWIQAFAWSDEQIREAIDVTDQYGIGWLMWNSKSEYSQASIPGSSEIEEVPMRVAVEDLPEIEPPPWG